MMVQDLQALVVAALTKVEGYLEREPRLATVGWHAGQRHSPTGMR